MIPKAGPQPCTYLIHPSYKCENHFDVEILVDGKFCDGCRAWRGVYEPLPEPVDIILAMGINNISEGQTLPDILDELKESHTFVREHSVWCKHQIPNTLTICTVIQPPKYVCFNEEHPYPYLADGRNKKWQVEKLNKTIQGLNREHHVWGPRLHIRGVWNVTYLRYSLALLDLGALYYVKTEEKFFSTKKLSFSTPTNSAKFCAVRANFTI